MRKRFLKTAFGAGLAAMVLAGCESSGTVSTGGYYDSMMWNDYYYHPYPDRPDRPERPDRPDRPDRPERPVHPIAPKPPVARPPVARPPVARPRPGPRR